MTSAACQVLVCAASSPEGPVGQMVGLSLICIGMVAAYFGPNEGRTWMLAGTVEWCGILTFSSSIRACKQKS